MESGTQRKVVAVVAVLAIIASVAALVTTVVPHSPKLNRGPFTGLGQAVAITTAKIIHEAGPIVVILTANHRIDGLPQFDTWQAFCAELKKHPALQLVATETINPEFSTDSNAIRSQFDTIIQKYPQISALVVFCGIPPWDAGRPFELPRNGPKLITIENEPAAQLREYFANGSLTAAILPRLVPDTNPVPPTTPAAWFNRQYQIYTAENYSTQFGGGGPQ